MFLKEERPRGCTLALAIDSRRRPQSLVLGAQRKSVTRDVPTRGTDGIGKDLVSDPQLVAVQATSPCPSPD